VSTHSFVVALLVLGASLAYGDDYPSCEVTKESQISFSSQRATDSLSITISGSPCYEGSLDISIASNDGHLLYHYEAPFSKHLIASWEDPALLADDIERFTKRVLGQDSIGSTSDLPNWLPEADYYEDNYQILQISREDYEELRLKDWITFTHPIHYEGHRVIAFDPEYRRSIIVSEGTL
jgi:hypothetical protein